MQGSVQSLERRCACQCGEDGQYYVLGTDFLGNEFFNLACRSFARYLVEASHELRQDVQWDFAPWNMKREKL